MRSSSPSVDERGHRRLALAHTPTPLALLGPTSEALGVRVWVKRDDATGGAETGNKIRKLEYLAAAAVDAGATHLVTCGAVQSNHARATAVVAARLGLRSVLLLRRRPGEEPRLVGNLLVDRLVGAETRFITPEQYRSRTALMDDVAREIGAAGGRAYVIPEGGSNALGSLGYVRAMGEVRAQLDAGAAGDVRRFDVVVHACGSGGTAAGVSVGASAYGVADRVLAACVCDDEAYFAGVVATIHEGIRELAPSLPAPAPLDFDASEKGPAYGVMNDDQKRVLVEVARADGLVLDPVYTGKAMCTLRAAVASGRVREGADVLFLHTGGLPGLLAEAQAFEGAL
ncbi:MAG: pyridoxal-phosphate dependent enzyme [Myxococcales bacterium]|jgi:D-cysteine desulfhydrase|nr:pyridoxal-phosphate dependent enzyme [Myxococcales bacterium]